MVLDNSPWWDCPLYHNFRGLDPRNAALQRDFLKLWRAEGIKMPVRRFRNGDVVCRGDYDAWVEEVGEAAAIAWRVEAMNF